MIEDTPTQTNDPLTEVHEWQQQDAVKAARNLADSEAAADAALAADQRRKNNRATAVAVGSIILAAPVLGIAGAHAIDATAQQNADVGQQAIDQQNASDARNSFEKGMDEGKVPIQVPSPAPTSNETTVPSVQQIDPNLQLPTLKAPDTH